ncbi:hypothetical protein HYFRA_00009047 [Hymenoscyphus fraxineus]|uniref:AB hydrolase-1 domain-containing protein n=1 Tax=Hymenoscyphus fraxineus TaxID=746836 RepID=A0A9N9KVK2_9HELO|nr:hypothetical protein HYFRA_00009047 [Hymenoscyphus fraxineus]
MGENLSSMLENVGLRTNNKSIHVVGHDFGSLFLSYIVAKYQSLARSCVFMSVPYTPAGVKIDMDALKPMMEEALGFELFGYRRLLNQPDAWQLLDANKDGLFSLGYSSDKLLISKFVPPGALEASLRADRQFPLEPWVTPEFKTTQDRLFQETGYRGSLLWYISRFGLHLGIVEEAAEGLELNIKCPVLFMTSAGDELSIPTDMEKFANDYEFAGIKSSTGYWVQMEGRDEVNKVLAEFLGKK